MKTFDNKCRECGTKLLGKDARNVGYCLACYNRSMADPEEGEFETTTNHYRSGRIEIFEPVNPEDEHRVYFFDRNGKEVYCKHEDPQTLLDLRQKEDYFMGTYIFYVPDSIL